MPTNAGKTRRNVPQFLEQVEHHADRNRANVGTVIDETNSLRQSLPSKRDVNSRRVAHDRVGFFQRRVNLLWE